jgi:hypothetical protein
MGQQMHRPCYKRSWTVTPADSEPFTIATSEGATWALRALIAVGSECLRPTDRNSGRLAMLIGSFATLGFGSWICRLVTAMVGRVFG